MLNVYISPPHRLGSNTQNSDEFRCKELQRVNPAIVEIKFEITATFHNLSPQLIPSHTTVMFKSLSHRFFGTILIRSISDYPPFRLHHGPIIFLNTPHKFLKYTAHF